MNAIKYYDYPHNIACIISSCERNQYGKKRRRKHSYIRNKI